VSRTNGKIISCRTLFRRDSVKDLYKTKSHRATAMQIETANGCKAKLLEVNSIVDILTASIAIRILFSTKNRDNKVKTENENAHQKYAHNRTCYIQTAGQTQCASAKATLTSGNYIRDGVHTRTGRYTTMQQLYVTVIADC
jgi:hypothetical protein